MLLDNRDRDGMLWATFIGLILAGAMVVLVGLLLLTKSTEAHDVGTLSKNAQFINDESANLIRQAINNDCRKLYEKLNSLYDVSKKYFDHNNRKKAEVILGSAGTASVIHGIALVAGLKVCEVQASQFLWEREFRFWHLSGGNYISSGEKTFSYRRLSHGERK